MLSVDSLSQLLPGLKDWANENPYLIAAWEALSESQKASEGFSRLYLQVKGI